MMLSFTALDRPSQPQAGPITRDDLYRIRGNFCNLREGAGAIYDGAGRLIRGAGIMYDPALPAVWQDKARWQRWMAKHRRYGTTHFTFGPFQPGPIYPGSEFSNPDLLHDPIMLRDFATELAETPMADGKGARFIVQLDGGEANPRERIHRDWERILTALSPFHDRMFVSPGWELIRASEWTSADFGYALKWLHGFGIKHIAAHLSPGRSAWSSNPIEESDPLQGAEAECWLREGGEHVTMLLFQFIPPSEQDKPELCRTMLSDVQLICSQHGMECWLDRGWDSIFRIAAGNRGWRRMAWTAFETVAWPVWHEGALRVKNGAATSKGGKQAMPSFGYDARGPHWKRLGVMLERVQDVVASSPARADVEPLFGNRVADVIERELVSRVGVEIGYGNGLPTSMLMSAAS